MTARLRCRTNADGPQDASAVRFEGETRPARPSSRPRERSDREPGPIPPPCGRSRPWGEGRLFLLPPALPECGGMDPRVSLRLPEDDEAAGLVLGFVPEQGSGGAWPRVVGAALGRHPRACPEDLQRMRAWQGREHGDEVRSDGHADPRDKPEDDDLVDVPRAQKPLSCDFQRLAPSRPVGPLL
jgi:hypothetical protein